MGNTESRFGYHVLRVKQGSPAANAGLISYFDYILGVGSQEVLTEASQSTVLATSAKASLGSELKLLCYNSLSDSVRVTSITPSSEWGDQNGGILGCSVRFVECSKVKELFWRVERISREDSPAALAGLKVGEWIVCSLDKVLVEERDFDYLVAKNPGAKLNFVIYNAESKSCREVAVQVGRNEWNNGYLGCEVSFGAISTVMRQEGVVGSESAVERKVEGEVEGEVAVEEKVGNAAISELPREPQSELPNYQGELPRQPQNELPRETQTQDQTETQAVQETSQLQSEFESLAIQQPVVENEPQTISLVFKEQPIASFTESEQSNDQPQEQVPVLEDLRLAEQAQSIQPTEFTNSTELFERTELANYSEAIQRAEPINSCEQVPRIETVNYTEPVQVMEPANYTEQVQGTEPAYSCEQGTELHPSQLLQEPQQSVPIENNYPSELIQPTEQFQSKPSFPLASAVNNSQPQQQIPTFFAGQSITETHLSLATQIIYSASPEASNASLNVFGTSTQEPVDLFGEPDQISRRSSLEFDEKVPEGEKDIQNVVFSPATEPQASVAAILTPDVIDLFQ